MWEYKSFDDLTAKEYYTILKERIRTFVVEQDSAYQEVDEIDLHATHLTKKEAGEVKAYARIYEHEDHIRIGRVLVPERFRGGGHGRELFGKAVDFIQSTYPSKTIEIQAEAYLKNFYGSYGFEPISDEYLDYDIPMVNMKLKSVNDRIN